MLSAIKDPNPVMVLLPKALLRMRDTRSFPANRPTRRNCRGSSMRPSATAATWEPQWPELGEHIVPFGVGELVREGSDGTVVSYGRPLPFCVQAADELARDRGLTFDVIDLRSIFPYDWDLISRSVQKTGRVLIVNEDTEVTNFGEHLLRRIVDEHFYDLAVRPRVLMGKHVPGIGMNQNYELNSIPQLGGIREALRELATDPA